MLIPSNDGHFALFATTTITPHHRTTTTGKGGITMPLTTADAHRQATIESIATIAKELQEDLGQRLIAYVTGNKSPKAIGRWASGEVPPRDKSERKLRDLYRTVLILKEVYGPDTIRAWLEGANPELDHQTPVDVLREKDSAVSVFQAADSFVR